MVERCDGSGCFGLRGSGVEAGIDVFLPDLESKLSPSDELEHYPSRTHILCFAFHVR